MNAMKKMIAVAAVAAAGFAAFAAGEEGAAPKSSDTYSFTYQACLRDAGGNVISNKAGKVQRSQSVTLRLWETATSTENEKPLWARRFAVYTDETGLFNLEVSDSVGSPLPGAAKENSLVEALTKAKAGQLYIGLEVEGSAAEIVPRQRLFAVPFAAVANDVRAITQDVPVSGQLRFEKNGKKVIVSGDGISQKGEGSSSTFNAVDATTVVAGTVKVATIKPNAVNATVTVDANLNVGYDATVQSNATVKGTLTSNLGEVVPVPVGGIIMWTRAELPDNVHWAICDGEIHNGVKTPNLKDRFVVGAGGAYNLTETGGEPTVTLTSKQAPLHEHSHDYWGNRYLKLRRGDLWSLGNEDQNVVTWYEWSNSPSGVQFPNSPSKRESAYRFGTSAAGGDNGFPVEAHENRPPYYALYYIMRVK